MTSAKRTGIAISPRVHVDIWGDKRGVLIVTMPEIQIGETEVMKYDVLLKGGTVIDAAQDLNAVRDVAIAGWCDRSRLNRIFPIDAATQTVSVKDKYVTPGLVDIHTHVYYGVTTWGIRPDAVCPTAGTTTVVDAG